MTDLLESAPDWIRDAPWTWVAVVALLVVAVFAYRLLARRVASRVADPETRHRHRKRARYAIASTVLAILVVLFFEQLRGLGTFLGFIGAGLAIALREYLASFLAWFYILAQRNLGLGSRIEVGGVRGDVIDIGVFKLTLVEIRGEGLGEQSTGRLVTIPNYKALTDPVYHFTAGTPYVWDEIDFAITFESDWEHAREIVDEVGWSVYEPHKEEIESGFRQVESEYAFRYGVTTPIVYTIIGESGVHLMLRYLSHVRQRRGNRDEISRRVLLAFRDEPNVELAYPTRRVYRTEIDAVRFGDIEPEEVGERPEAR